MKTMKKITAFAVVAAMLFTLFSVSAFASTLFAPQMKVDGKNAVSIVTDKATDPYINLDVYALDSEGNAIVSSMIQGITILPPSVVKSVEKLTVDGGFEKFVDGLTTSPAYFSLNTMAGVSSTSKIGTVKVTFDKAQIELNKSYEFNFKTESGTKATGYTLADNLQKLTVTFIEETEIQSATAVADKTVVYGADISTANLPTEVSCATKTTSGTDGTLNVPVSWKLDDVKTAPTVTEGAGENAKTVNKLTDDNKTITIEGTLNPAEGIKNTAGIKASATVTITPIADGTKTAATGKVKEDKDNGISKADITGSLPTEIAVEKNGIKDAFAVVWSDTITDYTDGKDYSENDHITVNGTLTSPSKNGLFTSDTAITGTVTVGPANIEGGSFELTDSTFVPNTKPAVKVTVPAAEVAKLKKSTEAEAESNRQIVAKIGDNETDVATDKFTDTEIDEARTAVAAAEAEGKDVTKLAPYTKTVTFSKTLSDLGYDYSKDDKKAFTVSVTVGGTTLLAGTKEDGTGIEEIGGTVVKPSSGGSSGSIGINKGNTTKTYAVTVVETKNGTATVSPEKAAQGTTVTVKAEPAEGYKVKSVTAVKADGTNVPVDEKAYTFTMPASAVKVTVEFEEGTEPVDPKPQEGKFVDVADDFWAAKDIYTLKDAGIIGGKSATEFDPEGDVTRAEFAKMVVGLFGYKATSDAVNFEDCKAEDWFTSYVAAGVEAGVIKGVSDTEFAPNATITREDACTILGRALNKVAQSNELKFTDADKVAEYAAPYVALLSELGYVNGYEDGSFAPTNNITRAEAAKIIAGIYNANKSAETVTDDKTETDANADAAVDEKVEEKVEEKTDEKAVDTIETEPEK